MSTKENFVKALKELTGFEDSGVQGAEASPEKMSVTPVKVTVDNPQVETPAFISDFKESYDEISRRDFGETQEEQTSIPKGMQIIGNLESDGRIEMLGRIEGDIDTKGAVIVTGAVVGNVNSGSLLVQNGKIKGNISSVGDIAIEDNSIIIGDVEAQNLRLDGKVKGNISVVQAAEMTSSALVNGNIETTIISTSRGTRINGSIVTRQNSDLDLDSEFDIEV